MADSSIQLPPDSTGSKVDTESLTVGGATVHRERVQIAGSTDTAIAPVDATAGLKVDLGADNDVTVTGTVTVDLGANNDVTVQGEAAENAAVSGNPVLTGGRYDATPRTLGDGDVGAIALDADGAVQIADGGNSLTVDGTVTADAGTGPWPVTDNGGSLTVDNADITTIAGAVVGSEMQVDIVSDGAGLATAANQPAVYTDDTSTHATGTSEGNLLMAAATPTDGAVDANDIGAVAMSTDRRLHVDAQIVGTDAALDVSGATVTVDGSGVTQPISAASLPLPTGAATAAAQLPDGHNVTVDNASGASAVNIQDGGNSITVDNGGTFAVQSASAGDRGHDASDSGNPVKMGAKAVAMGSNPTAVAADDRTNLYATRSGQLFTLGGHPNVVTREYVATTAQTNDAIIDTIAAGTRIVVTMIDVTVDNATTVDVGVRIGFGTASVPTVPTDGNSVAGVVLSHPGIAAGSGVVKGSGSGIIAIGASDEELRITNEVPTTGSLRVVVTYFTTAA